MHRRRTIALRTAIAATALLALGGVALSDSGNLTHALGREVTGAGPDRPGTADRPPEEQTARTILILGQDWHPEAQSHGRSDAIIVIHVPEHRFSATVVSIPRDSWVDLPGHGEGKISSALVLGGPALAATAVEELTRTRIDHVMTIDGAGFAEVTDALGGVTVHVPETVHDSARDVTWTAGPHRLDGAGALDYVGQRYGLPNGDLDRVRRQQQFLRALMAGLAERNSPGDLLSVYRFVDAVSGAVELEDQHSLGELRELAVSLRHLEPSDVVYTTAPVAGLDSVDGQSVVRLDHARGDELWKAVREDWSRDWVEQNDAGSDGPVA